MKEWLNNLKVNNKVLDFKVPYFSDIMYFTYGDMILIGSLAEHEKQKLKNKLKGGDRL